MTLIATYCGFLLVVSGVVWGVAGFLARFEPRLANWPLAWAMGLIVSFLVPVFSIALAWFPASNFAPYLSRITFMGPIGQIGADVSGGPVSVWLDWALLWPGMSILFLMGAAYFLTRLVTGRRRVAAIAQAAVPLYENSIGTPFWITESGRSPFAYSPFLRPQASRVVVPARFMDCFEAEERQAIIKHENAHIARRDDEVGLFLRVILALSWVSPFSHRMFSNWVMSAEVQCDLAVTTKASPEIRRAYAKTFVKAHRIAANRVLQYPAASFSTRHLRSEKMRIDYIMSGEVPVFKKIRHLAVLTTSVFLFMSVSIFGLAANARILDAPENARTLQSDEDGSQAARPSDYLPVNHIPPRYPRAAFEAGLEGYAIVTFTVDETGRTKNIEVIEWGGDPSFGNAAQKAAEQFIYEPRLVDGNPVATLGVKFKFTFNLGN